VIKGLIPTVQKPPLETPLSTPSNNEKHKPPLSLRKRITNYDTYHTIRWRIQRAFPGREKGNKKELLSEVALYIIP
jgi:hypothetical protein